VRPAQLAFRYPAIIAIAISALSCGRFQPGTQKCRRIPFFLTRASNSFRLRERFFLSTRNSFYLYEPFARHLLSQRNFSILQTSFYPFRRCILGAKFFVCHGWIYYAFADCFRQTYDNKSTTMLKWTCILGFLSSSNKQNFIYIDYLSVSRCCSIAQL